MWKGKMMSGARAAICFVGMCVVAVCFAAAYGYDASDFANVVVDYNGPFGISPYDDPYAVLGRPTTWIYDEWDELTYACSLVFPAYLTDPNGDKVVTTIDDGAEIVVGFDHRVMDDLGNLYGVDFILFGNAAFAADGWVEHNTDMDEYFLKSPTGVKSEPVLVSVAQDSNGPWYSFEDGPYGDTAFPANAFLWDTEANDWGEELDWLRPVDPNLGISEFDGLSVANAIELYDGSAGGTGFDLNDLDPNDYAALEADPNTGRKWIQYIKVEYLPGSSFAGEIDGFADVACCGDYKHPYPAGDVDKNCRVNYEDLGLLSGCWLVEISGPNDPNGIADVYEDGMIDFRDYAMMAGRWWDCNWECE
jgi:hypothetical protein